MPFTKDIVKIGEYQFDRNSLLLFREGSEVAIEPKVAEVLDYLYCNRERHIPLNELHENVWQGSIVSDTAVRRTISKLRQILDDNTKDSPQYIKSIPKRGYKLICNTDELANQVIHSDSILSLTGGTADALPNTHFPLFNFKRVGGLIAILGTILFFTLNPLQHTKKLQLSEPEPLELFDSQVQSLSVSTDKTKLAFSARTPGSSSYQLFIKYLETNKIEQVTFGEHSIPYAVFVQNDSAIVYVDYRSPVTELLYQPLVKQQGQFVQPKVLLDQFDKLAALEADNSPDSVILSILSNEEIALIHRLNLNTGELTQLSHSNRKGVFDYLAARLPNSQIYAYIRSNQQFNSYQLNVLDEQNNLTLLPVSIDNYVYGIEWLDKDTLILLDEKVLYALDISNYEKTTLLENHYSSFRSMTVTPDGQLLLNTQVPGPKHLTELALNTNSNEQSITSLPQHAIRTFYTSQPDTLIQLRRGKENVELYLVNRNNNTQKLIFNTPDMFDLMDISNDLQYVLMKIDEQLFVYSINDQNLITITNRDQQVESAKFEDMKPFSLIYTELDIDTWKVKRFNINENKIYSLTNGYRSIRPYNNGYIAAKPDGSLFILESFDSIPTPVNENISFDWVYSWDIHNNSLVWTETDLRNTFFNYINLETGEKVSIKQNANIISPNIDLSLDGKKVIFHANGVNKSTLNIYKLL